MDFGRPNLDGFAEGDEDNRDANETPEDAGGERAKSSKSAHSDDLQPETAVIDAEESAEQLPVEEQGETQEADGGQKDGDEAAEDEINKNEQQTLQHKEQEGGELSETVGKNEKSIAPHLDEEQMSVSLAEANETAETTGALEKGEVDAPSLAAGETTADSEAVAKDLADSEGGERTGAVVGTAKSKITSSTSLAQKKETAKRKHKPNKFADGNLILEEEDDQDYERIRSPAGIPPLEPISQVLDETERSHQQRVGKRGDEAADLLRALSPGGDPNKMDDKLAWQGLEDDYQEVEIEVKPTREELITKYQSLVEERERMHNANNLLHHKLADYFRKKKSDDQQQQPALFDKSSQEQEQRYLKYLSNIEQLKKQIEANRLDAEMDLDEIKLRCEMREEMVEKERIAFIRLKKETGAKSISTQTGRALTTQELQAQLEKERQKEKEVIAVRIENIKLKNQLRKREAELKAKEEFGEGLHMIDFEQLKIENQTYNEKIEERNEELMKLKKKINNTVQILTHVKEKLKFVNTENDKEKTNLTHFDENVKKNRDVLNKMKQSRDSLRMDNNKLKQNSGLLGNTILLRDFEVCVDKNDELEMRIEQLKRRHAELVLNSRGIKNKISETKNDN